MTPDFAWVWWDCDAEAWVTECWACNEPPVAVQALGIPDTQIRAMLLDAAEQHNRERHANRRILPYSRTEVR